MIFPLDRRDRAPRRSDGKVTGEWRRATRNEKKLILVDLLKIHGTSENPEKNVGSPTPGPMESFGGVSADYSARTRTNKTRHTDSLTGNDEDSVRAVVNGDLGTSSKFQPRGRAQAAACHPLIGHVPPFSFPAC